MKRTTKNIFVVCLIALFSSGVAGLTTYTIMQHSANKSLMMASDDSLFRQNPNMRLAGFNAIDAGPVDFTLAAENSLHAVVHITSTELSRTRTVQQAPDLFDFFFGDRSGQQRQIQSQPRVGFGSGVIISKDGYIVTNNHVIDNADEISVKLNDNRIFAGRVIGTDPATDLALVKIEGDNFPTLPIGDSDALKVGEWVLAVGNPFNLTSTVTAGIVSAKARSLGVYDGGVESFIQTDAAINRGNSGGALVNAKGELIGINAVLSSPTGAYAGYGFAIPTSIMTKVVSDLKQYGVVQRVILGIRGNSLSQYRQSEEWRKTQRDFGVNDGVYVSEIIENGSAAGGDIRKDDVIVGLNGRTVRSMADLQEALVRHRPGDKVEVRLIRDKKEKTIELTLKNEQGNTKVVRPVGGMEALGAAFQDLTDDTKRQLNVSTGIQISGIENQGRLAAAGIRRGFIVQKANGRIIRSVKDLEEVYNAAVKSGEADQVLFLSGIYPSGRRANYAIDLVQE